jgi:hypothetical protein
MVDWARIKRALAGQPEPVTKGNPLKDFDNIAELRTWCESHKELRLEKPNLCDDYARETRELAEADGYHLSLCLVADGVVYTTRIFDLGTWHISNLAVVSDTQEVWYVDLAFNKVIKICNFIPGGKY